MKETFLISGMTCSSCETAVQQKILGIPSVTSAEVSRENGTALIVSETPILINQLQQALGGLSSKYQANSPHLHHLDKELDSHNWIQVYWPVILIFSFITGITLFIELNSAEFNIWQWMNHFMAGFFLVFSFFKFLNLEGFAESYSTYDIIAKKWRSWGYVYATFELVIGLAFLTSVNPLITNALTFVIMSVSLIGVIQTVLNKRKIRCACLGDVFNLPMSTVTIIEDSLMIVMSALMIWYHLV